MDWKPLLAPLTTGPEALSSAGAVEARIGAARACFHAGVDAVGRLERARTPAAEEPPASFLAVIAAAFGPGDVATAWRRWRTARGEGDARAGALERLEQGVESAQREVSQLAAALDALGREEAAMVAELEALREDVAAAAAAAIRAAADQVSLRGGLDAIELARARALPVAGAGLDADAAVLEERLRRRVEDERHYAAAAQRLGAAMEVGGEALRWCGRLRTSLTQVYTEGCEVLHLLDARLARLAAEARAADLGSALSAGMETLHGSVKRVHVQAREGADLLLQRIDRLTEAPELLTPADPQRAAAEAEVAELVSRGAGRG